MRGVAGTPRLRRHRAGHRRRAGARSSGSPRKERRRSRSTVGSCAPPRSPGAPSSAPPPSTTSGLRCEDVVGDGTFETSPLAPGLVPHPDNWRARVRRPEILPHHPDGAAPRGLPRWQLTWPRSSGARDVAVLIGAPLSPRRCVATPRRRDVRRAGGRRRNHRSGRRPRRRQPRSEDRPRREGRLRLGDILEVIEDDSWRHPLPPATRVPPRLREPGRTTAPPGQRPPSCQPAPVPHSPLRPRRRRVQDRGPLVRHRAVAVRPHGRLAHRETAPRGHEAGGAGAPADAQHRPPRGRVPLLRRPGRRRPADPHGGAHGGLRVRRGHRQLHPGRPPDDRRGRDRRRRRGASRCPTTRARSSRSGPGSWSTPRGSGPTTCGPSTRARIPMRSARPRAST